MKLCRTSQGLLAALLSMAGGCGGCDDSATHATSSSAGANITHAEAWTFGAADLTQSFAIPPPCIMLEGSLRTAVERPTWVRSAAGKLDEVIGVQGPLLGLASLAEADAASVYRMAHGPADHFDIGWPRRGSAWRTHAPTTNQWLIGYDQGHGSTLWRGRIPRRDDTSMQGTLISNLERVIDLHCGAHGCGMLLAHAKPGKAEIRLAGAADALDDWLPLTVRHKNVKNAHATRLLSVDSRGFGAATVAFVDDLRVRLVRHQLTTDSGLPKSTISASIQAPHGSLDIVEQPRPAVLAYTGPLDARGCARAAAGVVLLPASGPTVTLRSPLPPSEATLTPLAGGWLVSWRSPLRCESRRQLLYAAVVGLDGQAVAPVTSVAEVDSYAVAALGDEVAMWVVQNQTVNWMRWRCALHH